MSVKNLTVMLDCSRNAILTVENVKKFVYTAILFDEARYLVEIEEEERFLVCICANDGLLRILEQP